MLLRHQLGLSQREASEQTGVSFGVWQGMEAGRATRGIDKAVAAISAKLGCDREWLMWGGPLSDPSDPAQQRRGGLEGVSGRSGWSALYDEAA